MQHNRTWSAVRHCNDKWRNPAFGHAFYTLIYVGWFYTSLGALYDL